MYRAKLFVYRRCLSQKQDSGQERSQCGEETSAVINLNKLPVVLGYPRQLQQLFQNLLSNLLMYSKDGISPRIDIEMAHAEENGEKYNDILASNNGIGFDE
jgi:light-regulated signal transduction histidine kinase (bacteriophytochrome)